MRSVESATISLQSLNPDTQRKRLTFEARVSISSGREWRGVCSRECRCPQLFVGSKTYHPCPYIPQPFPRHSTTNRTTQKEIHYQKRKRYQTQREKSCIINDKRYSEKKIHKKKCPIYNNPLPPPEPAAPLFGKTHEGVLAGLAVALAPPAGLATLCCCCCCPAPPPPPPKNPPSVN